MGSYVQDQEKEDIQIVDIYWDRIYLHIKLAGRDIYHKEYAIATRKEKGLYRIALNTETDEFVLNITNISDQEMLFNADWYIKYHNDNFAQETEIFEKELAEYEKDLEEYMKEKESNPDLPKPPKPWVPYEWKDIRVDLDTCYKLKDLDKIYRYSGNNYAYIFSFTPFKTRDEIICTIKTTFMVRHVDPEERVFRAESEYYSKRFKKWLIYHLERFHNHVYQLFTHITRKNGKRILMLSETRDMGGNLKALDDRLKERGLDKEFQITYSFHKTLESRRAKIFFLWLRLAVLTARQDYIFVDDYVPFFKYIKKDPRTKLIQVWHAGVGFKSVGYARFGESGSPYPYAAAHRQYDYAIVGGEALRDVYAEVFGINREKCLPYGLMRIDGYMDEEKIISFRENFYKEYPQFLDKKIILFAPTYRGNGQRSAHYPYSVLEQDKIYDMCGDEYVFLIKMHPFIRKRLLIEEEYKDRIIEFSDYPDINQLFYVTEILITDYSSNIYEFSLQKKPIISFAYDKAEYELIRSVHRTLDKYAPGKVCTTLDEVVDTIKKKDFEMEKLYKFVSENFDETEGYACDKVIDNILLK